MTTTISMANTRDTGLASRRQVERRKVLWGSRIANLDGSRYIKCETRDISAAGARIHLEDQQYVSERLYFMDMRNRIAYEARVIWQKAPEMGLQFLRSYRFDEVPSPQLRKHLAAEG
ncbi:MAG: PilZ domain-containing protein [Pseudomonadota bacterium]